MAPRPQPNCIVCQQRSKYTCVSCKANYCSVACYSQHKETCSAHSRSTDTPVDSRSTPECANRTTAEPSPEVSESLEDPPPLRPLTTLKWPYVPDISAYPDPLTRDDPKPLQIHQYEALATSETIRAMLRANPRLCELLTSVNALRGAEREEELQRALGVDSRLLKNEDTDTPLDEDTKAFRAFAEAVEVAVRGGHEDTLGLDWD